MEGPADGEGEKEGLESVLDDSAGPVIANPSLLDHLRAKASAKVQKSGRDELTLTNGTQRKVLATMTASLTARTLPSSLINVAKPRPQTTPCSL